MTTNEPTRFERLQERYRQRDLPWDHELPPPEIRAAAERLAPGRVLDLGCGSARASIYLAQGGWEADGVDFVPEAIDLARERVRAAGQEARVRLHIASVTDLSFLQPPYDLAIDVGCLHGLDAEERLAYAAEVARLVRPGGHYLLFAHLHEPGAETTPASMPDGVIETLFTPAFAIVQLERGTTVVAEQQWASAWYELVRHEQ
jgi:SAM-dependent methyltransferase